MAKWLQYGDDYEPLLVDDLHHFNRVMLAQEFGWTLDYIDSLSHEDMQAVIGVLNGVAMQKEHQRKLNEAKAKGAKRRR